MLALLVPAKLFFLYLVNSPLQILNGSVSDSHFFLRFELVALYLLMYTTKIIYDRTFLVQHQSFCIHIAAKLFKLFIQRNKGFIFFFNLQLCKANAFFNTGDLSFA